MARLLVKDAAASSNGSSVTTAGVDTTGANLIIVALSSNTANLEPTLSDSNSNAWTGLTAYAGSGCRIRLFYTYAPVVGAAHTFTASGVAVSVPSIHVMAFDGAASSPFDQENGANAASGTTLSTGSVTPTQDNEIIVSAGGNSFSGAQTLGVSGANSAITASFELAGSQHFFSAAAYGLQGSAAAENWTWSWFSSGGSEPVAAIATFKTVATSGGSGGAWAFA